MKVIIVDQSKIFFKFLFCIMDSKDWETIMFSSLLPWPQLSTVIALWVTLQCHGAACN